MGQSNRGAKPFVNVGYGLYPMADEGGYFTAINPTIETGIAQAVRATFLATNGIFCIVNGQSAGGKSIYLHYLRLICKTVPASATRGELLAAVDLVARYASGGTALAAKNVNSGDAAASIATVRFGDLTLNAEGANVRRLARAQTRAAIPVANEEYFLSFGAPVGGGALVLNGANAQRNIVDLPPMVVGPGHEGIIHAWWPGNATTAGIWEVEAGWWER